MRWLVAPIIAVAFLGLGWRLGVAAGVELEPEPDTVVLVPEACEDLRDAAVATMRVAAATPRLVVRSLEVTKVKHIKAVLARSGDRTDRLEVLARRVLDAMEGCR